MNPKKPRGLCANDCGRLVNQLAAKYCSLACWSQFHFKLRCSKIESGSYPAHANSRALRRYLTAKYGERCSRCGWAQRHPKTGHVPVEVEHIDGNWANNAASNLTLLC